MTMKNLFHSHAKTFHYSICLNSLLCIFRASGRKFANVLSTNNLLKNNRQVLFIERNCQKYYRFHCINPFSLNKVSIVLQSFVCCSPTILFLSKNSISYPEPICSRICSIQERSTLFALFLTVALVSIFRLTTKPNRLYGNVLELTLRIK